MDYKTCCEIFGIADLTFLPIAAMKVVESPQEERHAVFRKLLEANNYDVSYDWFQPIYEAELSEGKRKGQHFTPTGVNILVSELTGNVAGTVHEPTAGTGALVIADWWNFVSKRLPWDAHPSKKLYVVCELSDRAVPLLLINLAIRGMMAVVYHGDVLEDSYKAKYMVINRTDDAMGFSDIVPDPEDQLRFVRS